LHKNYRLLLIYLFFYFFFPLNVNGGKKKFGPKKVRVQQ